jgi:hypothetical protein
MDSVHDDDFCLRTAPVADRFLRELTVAERGIARTFKRSQSEALPLRS